MFVPDAEREFQEIRSRARRGGTGALCPGARCRGRAPAGRRRGRGGAGRVKRSVAGRSACEPPGKRTRRGAHGAHPPSAEGAAPGRTLGTMTQTPAFDKPKVSARGGSGSGSRVLVAPEGLGASTPRMRIEPLQAPSPLSSDPLLPLGCLMRDSEAERVPNPEAPLTGPLPLTGLPWVSVSASVRWAS